MICAQETKETRAWIEAGDIPGIELNAARPEVSACKYLGPWRAISEINGKIPWEDTVHLSLDDGRVATSSSMQKSAPNGVLPAFFTLDGEDGYFGHFTWGNNQVSAIVFRAISSSQQTVILEIDTDNELVIYSNFNHVKKIAPAKNIELGTNLLVPVPVNEGENIIAIKILSTDKPPHMRLSMICDQSRDFQAAWSASLSFLNKQVFNRGGKQDPPILWWDSLLDRLSLAVEVDDMKTGNPVFVKENMRHGSIIRNGVDSLAEGFYRITYKSGAEEVHEYFLIGPPRTVFEEVKNSLSGYSWDDGPRLNLEAQLRRGEILLEKTNYDTASREWQDKVVYTLGTLADFLELRKKGATEFSKDIPGLHIRGFVSQIDGARQFYRLFIPPSYSREKGVPLLLIMPTTISARNRPFIASPFMAAHRDAVQISRFAEKHGFALLWPGYRNAPEGWTYESAHDEEALEAVERDYNIDKSRISIYGVCSGGFLGGRLLTDYPNRFAAIVYDRAIFDRDQSVSKNFAGSDHFLKDWFSAINPSGRIIVNSSVNILVLHDGSRPAGHGEMQLTEDFLQEAQGKRSDIKSHIGRRPPGVELWDLIFGWLAHCKNNNPGKTAADIGREHGYSGPISELFAHPFIVVKGTQADQDGENCIEAATHLLSEKYGRQFYGASFVVKKDTEITEDELKTKSLILIGNPESNSIWKTLASQLPVKADARSLTIDGYSFSRKSAFMTLFRNPENRQNYLLLIGAADLKNLSSASNSDPCRTWVDGCVYEAGRTDAIREIKLDKVKPMLE
jgi:pimeloyl-ACP methyl ester carboxylesterase